jgi:sugar lactone lactonase YvrE
MLNRSEPCPAIESRRALAGRFSVRAPWLLAPALVACIAGSLAAEPRYISTYIGNGISGFNGDGLPLLGTALYLPQDGTYGPDGSFYFCDWNNHKIRKVNAGTVETVAGSGYIGDGPDGPAATIPLNHPTHISFDSQGRMLMAAWHNSKVKRIDFTTGMAVNLAGTGARAYGGDGGPAVQARLDLPSSVVEDSLGNIWISDQANFRLRVVDAGGNVNTVVGTGVPGYTGDGGPAIAATLSSPVGQSAPPAGRIDIDAQDRVYIADTRNHVIRRVDPDGTIRTVAGTGVASYTGDGGPAAAATLNGPTDVAVAADGSFYIADTKNNVVRKVDASGTITTIAGTGVQGYSGDGGLAVDAKLNRPYGVAIAPTGEIMIADTHNHRFRILTEEPIDNGPSGEEPPIEIVPCTSMIGSICTYAGSGFQGFTGDGRDRQRSALDQPCDIEFTPSGRVYIVDWNNHRIRQVMPDQTLRTVMGTDFVGDGPLDLSDMTAPGAPGLTVELNHPTDVQEFPNGDLMCMNWHNHKIRVLDPTTGLVLLVGGGPVGFAGDGGPVKAARFNQPPHGVLDPSGNLFFIDQRSQRIRLIADFAAERENAVITTIAGTGTPGFNGDGPALMTQFSFPTGTNPEPSGGITLAPDGTLYFADTWNHLIRKITFTGGDFTTGMVQTIAGTGAAGDGGDGGPALLAQINNPLDLELGPDGKLYFADTNNNRVRRIDLASGTIEAVAGTGVQGYSGDGGPALAATFDRPFGVAFDPYGNLYISDTFNNRIRKVKLTTIPEGPEPILPENYLETFVEVRNCRFSFEHGGIHIRVLTDPGSAAQYLADAPQLPVGSIVVKEEHGDGECGQGELLRWRVMRKEAPGFDPEDGDWSWQWLTPRREVVYNDKATCIGCHRQEDCVKRDYMCTLAGASSGLRPVLDSMPGTLLSVSGTPPAEGATQGRALNFEVYAVGADPKDGQGPMVVGFDGAKWHRLHTGQSGDLWWISDRLIEGAFYMAGENGMILRMNAETLEFERQSTPGGALLYGVWGTDLENLWAVGGDPLDADHGGVIWKWNGATWVADQNAAIPRPEGLPTLYKIWGTGPSNVYAVGRLGTILNWDGERWSNVQTGVSRPLFTIHGDAARAFAVGGAFDGLILGLDAGNFREETPSGAAQFNGVFALEGGLATAVGNEGSYAVRRNDGWEMKPNVEAALPFDFHGTWMDAAGGVWAVGGDLTVDKAYGVLAFAGSAPVGREFAAGQSCASGPIGQPATVSYTRDILPIFRRSNCMNSGCHGGALVSSEYSLTFDGLFGPGQVARNQGMCNIVPGKPEASLLVEKIRPNPRFGARMPNGFPPLSDADIELIETWIREGAIRDPSPLFARGDANVDGGVNLSDAIAILQYLFTGDSFLQCLSAGDIDDNSQVNITDPIALLGYLFNGSPPSVPEPFPGCGVDPTSDDLGCAAYNKCD